MQFSSINFRLGKINRKCSPIKVFDDRIINFLNYLSKNIMSEKNLDYFLIYSHLAFGVEKKT